jgi:hypothetical protein
MLKSIISITVQCVRVILNLIFIYFSCRTNQIPSNHKNHFLIEIDQNINIYSTLLNPLEPKWHMVPSFWCFVQLLTFLGTKLSFEEGKRLNCLTEKIINVSSFYRVKILLLFIIYIQ